MIDLLVRGGTVVYPWGMIEADVAISGEKIAALGLGDEMPSPARTVDAHGLYVLPGLVDTHTHFEAPARGAVGGDDFFTGTVSAAFGGVTTVIDFAIPGYGESVLSTLRERKRQASKAFIDYSFHAAIVESTPERISEIADLGEEGVTSLKVFMISVNDGVCTNTGSLLTIMNEASRHGMLVGVHAESPSLESTGNTAYAQAEGHPWQHHGDIKGNACEAVAVAEAIACAEAAGVPLFVHHVTTEEAVALMADAQGRRLPVMGETCPHYLLLTRDLYREADGYLYLMSPPLRSRKDQEALWDGLRSGVLSNIASDHCTYTAAEKKATMANGVAGIESMLSLLYTHGVRRDRLTLPDVVRLASHNPALIFGLFPQKGVIAPGSDADIVILDPGLKQTIRADALHTDTGYSIYESMELVGGPVMTISRGDIVVDHGEVFGECGRGRLASGHLPVPINALRPEKDYQNAWRSSKTAQSTT